MASNGTSGNGNQLLVVGDTSGVTLIDPSTPLKRLNYFDGKFLRASDFNVEQSYLRQLVAISNQGLGAGVVYGYDTTLGSGDNIQIGPGLAIDPSGRVLLMQATVTQSIQALIDATKKLAPAAPDASGKTGAGVFNDCVEVAAPPPTTVIAVSDIYVIAICAAEALCGQADVYGKLCEEACVTSTDRPFRLDGIVIRAIPLQLVTPFPISQQVAIDSNLYLRSKVAHSWYADEVLKHPSAISRPGLLSTVWCLGAGYDSSCCEVPLAVVARAGATTIFLDAWIVRRERIDAPARRYWQWKMMMRPWDVFLAQILQFQCQLAEVLSGAFVPGSRNVNPCANEHQTLGEAATLIEEVRAGLASYRGAAAPDAAPSTQPPLMALSLTRIVGLRDKIANVLSTAATPSQPTDRILIRGGIIELPPAGYLPVMNGTSVSVNDQVRALLGDGLDLRFCITTADYVAHALEEAQHMDRISLIQGLDNPSNKPRVDILVPDGNPITTGVSPDAKLYDSVATFSTQQTGALVYKGAGREEALSAGGTSLYVAGAGLSQGISTKFAALVRPLASAAAAPLSSISLTPDLERSAFVRNDPTSSVHFASQLNAAASMARSRFSGAVAGVAPLPAATAATETIDGFWLNARTEKSIKDLGVFEQTPISGRVIAAPHSQTPTAFEAAASGVLTVTDIIPQTGNLLVVKTSLNLTLTMSSIAFQQAQSQETEFITIRRLNLAATFSYDANNLNGTITVDVFDPANPDSSNLSRPMFRVIKRYAAAPLSADYELDSTSNDQSYPPQTVFTKMAELGLTGDLDVVRPGNPNHMLAENGLDLVQAALPQIEPSFKQAGEAALFPQLPPATTELTIQAIRDWVMFTKRREEQCALDVPPSPAAPPRRYRIYNVLNSMDEADSVIKTLQAAAANSATNPVNSAAIITRVIGDRPQPDLVVTFVGGSAQPLYDPDAARGDWEAFTPKPGGTIVAAAYGSKGDDDAILLGSRRAQFETTISVDSKVKATTVDIPIVPFPQGAIPPDADGIMLFVTINDTTCLAVYSLSNPDFFKRLCAVIPLDGETEIKNIMAQFGARSLGSVNFLQGTANIADNSAAAVTAQLTNEQVSQIALWTKSNDTQPIYQQQALAIVSALGNVVAPGGLQVQSVVSSQNVMLPPCPAIALLLAEPRVTGTVVPTEQPVSAPAVAPLPRRRASRGPR